MLKMIRKTLFKRGQYSGVLWKGREIGFNSKYKEKWEFIAKGQGTGQWWKITKTSGVRGE